MTPAQADAHRRASFGPHFILGQNPPTGAGGLAQTFGVIGTLARSCTILPMQLTTGTVVGGKIVIDGDPLPEGAVVTILAREEHETFVVSPEMEAELLESIAEADRGETISADELLQRLRRIS